MKNNNASVWTPRQLSQRTGVSVPTLHFYESKGLIMATRTSGNQRRYRRDMVRRIAFIQAGQQVGIALKEIKTLFDQLPNQRTPSAADWQTIAQSWSALLDARIERLKLLRDKVDSCIQCGCLSLEKCHLYNPDDTLGSQLPQLHQLNPPA